MFNCGKMEASDVCEDLLQQLALLKERLNLAIKIRKTKIIQRRARLWSFRRALRRLKFRRVVLGDEFIETTWHYNRIRWILDDDKKQKWLILD